MSISFRPAVRTKTPLILGIAGPSKAGKTMSALRLATGLAEGGRIVFIDTESGRGLQYAESFKYDYAQLAAPFTSERYEEMLAAAREAKAAVTIVDSMSHEHEGPGGMLERHEDELKRMAGEDYQKRERMKFTAWIRPKAAHNRFVNSLLQMPCHVILAFRAKNKLELRKDDKGKVEPVQVGWTPICSDRLEYETTFTLVLPEGARGVPDLSANSSALRTPFDTFIRPGVQLDEALGVRLAQWAKGVAEPATQTAQPPPAPKKDRVAAGRTAVIARVLELAEKQGWASKDLFQLLLGRPVARSSEVTEADLTTLARLSDTEILAEMEAHLAQ